MLLRLASFLILSTSSQTCTTTVSNTAYSRLSSIVFSSSVVLTVCPIWVISRMKNCLSCSIWTLSFPATILSLTSHSTMLECELHNVAIHDMHTCHFVSPCHVRYSLAIIAFSVVLQVREAWGGRRVFTCWTSCLVLLTQNCCSLMHAYVPTHTHVSIFSTKDIRESVDSLCRDGTDAQYMQYLSKYRITSPQIH